MENSKQKVIEVIDDDEDEDDEPRIRKEHSNFSVFLNKYFHHIDRGGHLRTEILAGVCMFFISICLIFINMQMLGGYINGELNLSTSPNDSASIEAALTYISIYQASLLVSFIGSVAIGLIARLPFIQISLMGLSTSLISFISVGSGLTYSNLILISLISSVIYAVLVGVPYCRRFLFKALPAPIRKALPLFSGLLIVVMAVSISGVTSLFKLPSGNLTSFTSYTSVLSTSSSGLAGVAFSGAMIAFFAYFIFAGLKIKHPFFFSFLTGTLSFILIDVIKYGISGSSTGDVNSFINFGRVWLIAGSQSSPTTPYGDSYMTYLGEGFSRIFSSFGSCLKQGMDFSSYQGNAFLLVITSVLSLVSFNFADLEGTLQASGEDINSDIADEKMKVDIISEEGTRKLHYINAGLNILAPFMGIGVMGLSKVSVIGVKEKAKSGIASLVCSLGFLISLFTFGFAAIFATATYGVNSMNEFNYFAYGNGGLVYLIQGVRFGIADCIMALVGINMVVSALKSLKGEDMASYLPILAGALFSLIYSDLVFGVCISVAIYQVFILLNGLLISKKKDERNIKERFLTNYKKTTIPQLCLSGGMLVLLILKLV